MKKILVLLVLVLMFLIGSSGFQKTGATAITDEERLLFAQEPGYDYILATRKGIWVLRGEVYRLSEYSVGLTDVDGFPKVPVRAIAEFLGYTVDWNPETQEVIMTVVSYDGFFVKKTTVLIEEPLIVEGRTMIPISCLYILNWDRGHIMEVVSATEEYALFQIRVSG